MVAELVLGILSSHELAFRMLEFMPVNFREVWNLSVVGLGG